MEHPLLSHIYIFHVDSLNGGSRVDQMKEALRKLFAHVEGAQEMAVDLEARLLTLSSSRPLDIAAIKVGLQPYGFHLREQKEDLSSSDSASKVMNVCVEGMTCHSCEVIIERAWKKIEGVSKIDVQASKGKAKVAFSGRAPSIAQLQNALGEGKYVVSENGTGISTTKPSFFQLVSLFALVLILGKILSNIGLFKTSFAIGAGMSLGAIFVVGLVAASSSCIAVSGGLLLSAAATFNARYGSVTSIGRMRPVVLFVAGRVAGYALFGGLLGLIGEALSPSPFVTAMIAMLAAVYMIVMGLDMLQIAPMWLKRLMPKMPKQLSHRLMDAEGKAHPLMPIGLGAATFFLPCGFTQALQLYALTTGSFMTGALSMMAFALGTAPALLLLGWASSSLKGKAGRFFYKFSGALVVVLGLWNVQNGLVLAGYPISWPNFTASATTQEAGTKAPPDLVPIVDGKQIVKMSVSYGYQPDHFTIRAGIPVRWEIDATDGGGCGSVLVSRQLGIQKILDLSPSNVIEFTPEITGVVPFSCSMGMYRGSFTILPAA